MCSLNSTRQGAGKSFEFERDVAGSRKVGSRNGCGLGEAGRFASNFRHCTYLNVVPVRILDVTGTYIGC